jgi:hypothetical protein
MTILVIPASAGTVEATVKASRAIAGMQLPSTSPII